MVVDSINNFFKSNCNNYNEVRGCSLAFSIHSPKTPSMFLSECNEDYLTRVQCKSNNMVKDDKVAPSGSSQLEYTTSKSQSIQVSKATDHTFNMELQHVESIPPVLNNNAANDNNMFNIQLNYDINQALDSELWDSNFQAILLYGLIEHLASNIKNIKKSLGRM